MFYKRTLFLAAALFLLALPTAAAEVAGDDVYCFSSGDFSGDDLAGIVVTGLPEQEVGTVLLEDRIICPGDVLTAAQLDRLTFHPVCREHDSTAVLTYLPVSGRQVGAEALLTISIRGKENHAPAAEDFAAETYKNLPLDGKLKVKDPEGEAMTYTIVRQPKRGNVEIREDGSFVYTPKKNKVGIDSFVYTAADASGRVSREATVTITIVKPTDSAQYTDTVGTEYRFAAEWMKNTGIFVGEKLDGNACFHPEKTVSRGEFLTMLVRTLDIPTDNSDMTFSEEVPQWLKPYLAAAVRSGISAGTPQEDFGEAITGSEAAVMIRNALEVDVVDAFSLNGEALTRADAALVLYRTAQLAEEAPGMTVIRRQK